ncbi:DUF4062 domain-containing protein [Exiguobacterium acetylicum]|uniref:DUF4062 domain-containing protein n=1 Tax=Exiguobacterium acetylicum TaxID=41170 RepID=UPI00223A6CCE|nr:DUF4062 domain-containing protein [Exiguobacterium acetylicum]
MDKKMQVFISSTYKDLIEERQAAVEAILKADHIPAGMELFKAGDETQLTVIKRWIDESDIYVLIIGGRYGSIDPKSGLSYTHLEFQMAIESGIPMFALILTEEMTIQKILSSTSPSLKNEDLTETKPKLKKLHKAFVDEVAGDNRIVSFIENIHHLQSEIFVSINNIIKTRQLTGWVRANDSKLISENIALKEKNNSLIKEINSLKNKSTNDKSLAVETVKYPLPTLENVGGFSLKFIADYLRHEHLSGDLSEDFLISNHIKNRFPTALELLTIHPVNRKLIGGIPKDVWNTDYLGQYIHDYLIPVLKIFNLVEVKASHKGYQFESYHLNTNGIFVLTNLLKSLNE